MYLLFQHGDFPIRQPESLERGNPNLMVVSFFKWMGSTFRLDVFHHHCQTPWFEFSRLFPLNCRKVTLNPGDPITTWEWYWNPHTMLRRWLDTPIISWEYDWMPSEIKNQPQKNQFAEFRSRNCHSGLRMAPGNLRIGLFLNWLLVQLT